MLSVRKGSPFTGDRKGRPYSATGSRAEAVGAGLAPARLSEQKIAVILSKG